MGIPKSTLSNWLTEVSLSAQAKKRLEDREREGGVKALIKRNKEQTINAQIRATEAKEKATSEIQPLSTLDLQLAGIILYWAEGYKRLKIKDGKEVVAHPIGFTNCDPAMINTFITFLINVMSIPKEKISINLRLFAHMDVEKEIDYWSTVTGIPKSQFDKPSFVISRASKGIRPFNRLPHGIAKVQVGDTKSFYRLMGWIDGIKERLAQFSIKV